MHGWIRTGAIAAIATLAVACSKTPPEGPAKSAVPTPIAPTPAATAEAPAEVHGDGKTGGKGKVSAVYVDGVPKAVMKFGELPASMKPRPMPQIDTLDVPRYYRLIDYVTALGIEPSSIKMMHFYGSHERVAMMTGAELTRFKDEVVFDFSSQVTGRPRARWSTGQLAVKTRIDNIHAFTIYVSKPAPKWNDEEGFLEFEHGKALETIPYLVGEVPKGTRVYVDGKLMGWVKRRTLPDKLIADGSERIYPKFSFAKYLDSLGVDVSQAKTIDFMASDELAVRVSGKDLLAKKDDFNFAMPRRNSGKVKALFPSDKWASVTAVEVFVKSAPPVRKPEPEVIRQQQAGSDETQDGTQNDANGNGGDQAQGVNGALRNEDDDE